MRSPKKRTRTVGLSAPLTAGFCQRVRFLVDKYDEGNVTAASRRLKVSQRGLQKVYSGVTSEPRLRMITAVLNAYPSEDAAWILTGKVRPIQEQIASAAHAMLAERLSNLASVELDQVLPDRHHRRKLG